MQYPYLETAKKKPEQCNIDATKIGTLQRLFQLKVAHYADQ